MTHKVLSTNSIYKWSALFPAKTLSQKEKITWHDIRETNFQFRIQPQSIKTRYPTDACSRTHPVGKFKVLVRSPRLDLKHFLFLLFWHPLEEVAWKGEFNKLIQLLPAAESKKIEQLR